MSKIKIHYTLIHENDVIEFSTLGIFNQNKIHFKEHDTTFDIFISEDSVLLKRKNQDYSLCIEFNITNSKGTYNIDKIGEIELIPTINKLLIKEGQVEIDYILNDETFKFNLQYEVIE